MEVKPILRDNEPILYLALTQADVNELCRLIGQTKSGQLNRVDPDPNYECEGHASDVFGMLYMKLSDYSVGVREGFQDEQS